MKNFKSILTLSLILGVTTWSLSRAENIQESPQLAMAVHSNFWPQVSQKLFDRFQESQGSLPNGFDYVSPDWMNDPQLPGRMAPFKSTIEGIQETIETWLMGARLADPRLEGSIRNLSWSVRFQSLNVEPRPNASGFGLRFSAVLSGLDINLETLRVRDQNNAWLGDFGINNLRVSLNSQDQKTLAITGEIALRMNSAGNWEFTVESLSVPFDHEYFVVDFDRPLHIPPISLSINGNRRQLNTTRVEEALLAFKDPVIRMLAVYIQDYGRSTLQDLVSQALNQDSGLIESKLQEVTSLPFWELGSAFRLSSNSSGAAILGLHSLSQIQSLALEPTRIHAMGLTTDPNHHLSAYVGIDVINRWLSGQFALGNWNSIATEDDVIHFTEAPQFIVKTNTDGTRQLQLALQIEKAVRGIETLALRNPFRFSVNVNVELTLSESGQMSVQLSSFDLESADFDRSTVRGRIWHRKVRRTLQKELREFNRDLRTQPKILFPNTELPEAVRALGVRANQWILSQDGLIGLGLRLE